MDSNTFKTAEGVRTHTYTHIQKQEYPFFVYNMAAFLVGITVYSS